MNRTTLAPEKPKRDRRQALGMTALAMVVVGILWNVPALDFIVYPLRLFVTYVHEAGHSLAALLTGGEVIGFLVSPNGSGVATTAGGSRALILPAGYLGAAFFGSMLFYLTNRFPSLSNTLATALGIGMVLFTVLFARPDESGLPVALMVGSIFGMLMVIIGLRANQLMTLLLLNVLAVMTALNAVLDVWFLTQQIGASRGAVRNDAVAFTEQVTPLIPAQFVAFTWMVIAAAMFAVAVWYGIIKPLRHEVNDSYDAITGRNRPSAPEL
ncbi:MAG: M50 family metallopeptidase [Aggregatilineales bacterium]